MTDISYLHFSHPVVRCPSKMDHQKQVIHSTSLIRGPDTARKTKKQNKKTRYIVILNTEILHTSNILFTQIPRSTVATMH